MQKIGLYLPNHLGDAVVASSLISWCAKSKLKPALIAKQYLKPLFHKDPRISTFIPVNQNYTGIVKTIRDLNRLNLTVCLVMPKSFFSAWLVWKAKVRRRAGYSFDYRKYFLNDIIPMYEYHHQPLRQFYFNLAYPYLPGSPPPYPDLFIPPADINSFSLDSDSIEQSADRIGIDPGAAYGKSKSWPDQRWIDLIKNLEKIYKVVLVGIRDLSEWEKNFSSVINLSGKTSLTELPYLLRNLKLFISGDTGSMHLAAALKVDTISLFGSSSPVWTSPWGKGRHIIIYKNLSCSPCFKKTCPKGDMKCMNSITIEEVISKVDQLLQSKI